MPATLLKIDLVEHHQPTHHSLRCNCKRCQKAYSWQYTNGVRN